MVARTRSIYLDEKVWDELEAEAEKQERSINWLVARMVRDALAAKKKGGTRKK